MAQPAELGLGRSASQSHPVGPVDAIAGMREPVGELAVVGEQDEPSRVGIQPPDRIEPLPRVHQLDDRAPGSTVAGRPSASTVFEPSTSRAGSLTVFPSTVTRPAAINSSARRREATPQCARYFASRIGSAR